VTLKKMTPASRKKIFYSVISGAMLTASFAPSKLDWLAWFALVPLLKSLDHARPSQAFRLGFLAGLAHYLTLIYWVVVAMKNYGGLNFFTSFSVLFLLCLYLSLYPALFSYLLCHIRGSVFMLFLMASLWVGLELIRAKVLTGFPWCLLGYTQFRNLTLIQIVDMVGVYGVSFAIILSNGLIYCLLFDRDFSKKSALKWEILGISLVAFFTLAYGHYRLGEEETGDGGERAIKVAIVQGNIDQSIKWNPAYQEKTLDTYERLTRSTSSFKPSLIVWPETAVPFFFQESKKYAPRVFEISRQSGAELIFGSPAYQRKDRRTAYYNRVYLLSPQGGLSGYYDKVHLVPFGEYVPLKRFLPFVHRLVPAAGDFASGEKIEPIRLLHLPAGILICFEVIFPELARTQTKKGAAVLVNLTNDAWFGMTSAPHQHLSMAVFRAVENKRPMFRAANTGISAFIDSKGRIVTHGELFTEEVLKQELELTHSSLRIYTRYGDLFAFTLLIISLIKVIRVLWYNKIIKPH